MVMSENRAARQDIRPLEIGLLNLMPKKNNDGNAVRAVDRSNPASDRLDFDPHV